jgi:hypothetical protein
MKIRAVSLVLLGAVSCFSSEALADSILIAQNIGHQTVSISGVEGGAAAEGFKMMDEAGAQSCHKVEGQEMIGHDITATEAFMNLVRYSMEFQIDPTSSLNVQNSDDASQRISMTGAPAEELYGYMEKSGLQKHLDIDGNHIQGANERCEVLFVGKAHYSCTIDVHS